MTKGPWRLFWPGLPDLWQHGAWSGLLLAVAFAAVLNLAVAVTTVWTELIGSELRLAVWGVVLSVWAISAVTAWRRGGSQGSAEDLFSRATGEYLKGNWFEAEKLLGQILRRNRRDAEALLMLATLLRHTARNQEAAEVLARLSRLEDAAKWHMEIQRELELATAQTAAPIAPVVPQHRIRPTPRVA